MLIADRYEIIDKLGEGGMGEVYRAMDTRTQTLVAVKHLRQDLNQLDSTLLERFQREGAALRDLNHPNIVKMLDMIQHDKQHYLVMEYIDGGDLADVLRDSGKLPLAKVLQIALELADALTRAHYLNIVHRDLKPANIMMTAAGSPRLTDFGVAHIASQERLTGTGTSVGTLDYLPPEALNGDPVDTRADIWAFGVMLYEMLAGVRPFSGANMSHMINNILREPPPDLRLLRPDVPEMMVELVERMLEKDRDQRIRSVRMVGAELEAIIHGDGASRFTPKTPTPAPVKTDTLALQTPKHLFISYSRDDTDQMTQVRDCLRAEGLEVWTDEGIQPGTPSWQYAIEQAILGAHGMVVLFSPSATASKWVRAELDFAEKQGVPIFPLLVRGDTTNAIPFGYTLYQWIDARKDIENAVSKLVGVLKKVTAETAIGGHTAMMDAPTTAIRRSRLPIFAAAMLAIAVIGIGALLSSGVLQPSVPTPTPTNAPSPTPRLVADSAELPADWELMTLEDSRVLVPEGWSDLNLDMMTQIGNNSLPLDETGMTFFRNLTENVTFAGKIQWVEFNLISLGVEDSDLPLPLEATRQRYIELFERVGSVVAESSIVSLPQGDAIFLRLNYPGNVPIDADVHILPHGGRDYAFSFAYHRANKDKMRPVFEQALASWQIDVNEDTPLPSLATPEAESSVLPEGWRRLEGEHTSFAIPPEWVGSDGRNASLINSTLNMIGGTSAVTEDFSSWVNALNIDVIGLQIKADRIIFAGTIYQPPSMLQNDLGTASDFVSSIMQTMSTDTMRVTPVSNESVVIRAGEARKLVMRLNFQNRPPLLNLSYLVVDPEDFALYGIAFTFFESQSDDVMPIIEQIVETFALVK